MSADWFTEELRGQTVGYALGRPRQKHHVYKYEIAGPAALRRTALCHGVQGVVIVSSKGDLDLSSEADCMAWLKGQTGIIGRGQFSAGENLESKLMAYQYASLCERCKTSYQRKKP